MKKKISVLLAAVMTASCFCACGSSSSASGTASSDAAAKSAASDITTVEEGSLIMATNAAFPPYEYYDGDDIVGIDVEIAQAIADKLGLELVVNDMDFGSIISTVQDGQADIGAAGITVTDDRLENVDFSDSYATGVQVIVVRDDSDITSADDLKGRTIGVQENTTGYLYCERDYGGENVSSFSKGIDAIAALKSGEIDSVVIDNEPAKAFVRANDGLKILDTAYVTEEYAIAVSKDNEALLDAVNKAMHEMKADGSLQDIIDAHINTK